MSNQKTLNTLINHTLLFALMKSYFMAISPSEGSHADHWSKSASTTLGVNAVVLQEDLC